MKYIVKNQNRESNENNCQFTSVELSEQLNVFVNSYSLKYPSCFSKNLCGICPYETSFNKMKVLSDNDKSKLIEFFNEFNITPQDIKNEEMQDEHKLKLLSEFLDENRTIFRREEERIIYTKEFRRLQYKTQVMVNSASDDQRTRLLHSLEVQKIGRKIAIALKANYELVEVIAIAHDIGHAPFGHAGEHAISNYLNNKMAGSFSHALQSVKVIDSLASQRTLKPMGLKGLGISDFVLEGVLKHDSDSFSDNLSSASYRLQYECSNLYKPLGLTNYTKYKDNKVYIGGIESQIVCMADKIAYMSHDWEEFVAVDLLEVMLSRVNAIIIQLDDFVEHKDSYKYDFIQNIERNDLISINKSFYDLKDFFYSEDYNSNFENFIDKLKKLIYILDNAVNQQEKYPSSYVLFSKEQYKLLRSFFKISWAWICVTKITPKKVGGKMDIVFVLYKYLSDTTSHRTVPNLISALVTNSNEKLNCSSDPIDSKDILINYCNKIWENKLNDSNIGYDRKVLTRNEKKFVKSMLKDSFVISFGREYSEAVSFIRDFIYDEYINSTRIKFMTNRAEIIIEKLLDFYYENPQMLPLKQRNRIEFETCIFGITKKNY